MQSGNILHNHSPTSDDLGIFGHHAPKEAFSPLDDQPPRKIVKPGDHVEISEIGRQLQVAKETSAESSRATESISKLKADFEKGATEEISNDSQELTEEEQKQVMELKSRDREVRAHEQAHMAAAGGYASGGPSFEYQRGPDGNLYAVGGHVNIDTAPVPNDPEATIRKAQVVRRAANAPANPSPQDRRVSAQAGQMENKARQELIRQKSEENVDTPARSSDPDKGPESVGERLHLVA